MAHKNGFNISYLHLKLKAKGSIKGKTNHILLALVVNRKENRTKIRT